MDKPRRGEGSYEKKLFFAILVFSLRFSYQSADAFVTKTPSFMPICPQRPVSTIFQTYEKPPSNEPDEPENSTDGHSKGPNDSILDRFLSPTIDDTGLPLSDALVAQIVAPSLQVFWLGLNHAPLPTWLQPISPQIFPTRGSLVAPTLIHGAGLASCWIAGALAGKAYEQDAYDLNAPNGGYGTTVARVLKSGAFATGLLIVSTQLDLLLEFGRNVQPGESEEIDLRLLVAIVEMINDIFFEAVSILLWRLYLTRQSSRIDSR